MMSVIVPASCRLQTATAVACQVRRRRFVGAQDERAEAAVVRRRHHLHHLDAVRFDGEFLIAVEHAHGPSRLDDEHGTERRLKELRLLANLFEHRIRLEFQEEADHRADGATLTGA